MIQKNVTFLDYKNCVILLLNSYFSELWNYYIAWILHCFRTDMQHNDGTVAEQYTQKKDLIESKKMISLNDFLWFKEMICLNEIKFIWSKQNIFEPIKYLFESN